MMEGLLRWTGFALGIVADVLAPDVSIAVIVALALAGGAAARTLEGHHHPVFDRRPLCR